MGAQRKRWHKGGVELFLGVKNVFDENWERPVVERPKGFITGRITRFRKWHWFFAKLAFINAYPPCFYTVLVLNGLCINRMWIYLNPYPTYFIMIPRLFLASFVPSLGDSTVDPKKLAAGVHEFFCYAPIRFLGISRFSIPNSLGSRQSGVTLVALALVQSRKYLSSSFVFSFMCSLCTPWCRLCL